MADSSFFFCTNICTCCTEKHLEIGLISTQLSMVKTNSVLGWCIAKPLYADQFMELVKFQV
jgi:hypothetical protein